MLKIVYPICCGIDVHKKFVVATLATTNSNNVTTYQTKQFSTFTDDLLSLVSWLKDNNCSEVCMESTGKYWIPIFNVLETSYHITLANPKYIKAIPGKKTDKKDSIWIADLHKHGLVRDSLIQPKSIRDLKDVIRYRRKLVSMRSSEKNRFQNSLTVSNIMIASVVSDTFDKSSVAIINHMISSPEDTDFDYESLLHKKLKSKTSDIGRSIANHTLSATQASKMSVAFKHFDYINECIDLMDETIAILAAPFQNEINHICTIPGIKELATTTIISEIGVDMSKFDSSKHLCSWAGLTPQNNESAGKKKSVRINKTGSYLKPILVQCALIAIARTMLTCIYHMLSKEENFNHELYLTAVIKEPSVMSSTYQLNQAILLLQQNGYTVNILDPTLSST
ncbi:IS110 family RNA-guided transposase [Cellulosilyticum ruminicola]|uniref:IS110 family transposase n=1 Tax=Cellulosilyticum ruminicola TaxID=425254 RepID=UPI0006D270E5|nr:IS110 family transposase [Cellulosilyticum ruminicola]